MSSRALTTVLAGAAVSAFIAAPAAAGNLIVSRPILFSWLDGGTNDEDGQVDGVFTATTLLIDKGGAVTLDNTSATFHLAGNFEIRGDGAIRTPARSREDEGATVLIKANGQILLRGNALLLSNGAKRGGSITLCSPTVSMRDDARIEARGLAEGSIGGTVTLQGSEAVTLWRFAPEPMIDASGASGGKIFIISCGAAANAVYVKGTLYAKGRSGAGGTIDLQARQGGVELRSNAPVNRYFFAGGREDAGSVKISAALSVSPAAPTGSPAPVVVPSAPSSMPCAGCYEAGGCLEGRWAQDIFCSPGVLGDAYRGSGTVYAATTWNDGAGPAMYVGGDFYLAGCSAASNIAKWNGSTWSPLGAGVNGDVSALTVFDDGSGPALYAGGKFTTAGASSASHVARWNGSTWSPLGAGVNGDVSALTVFDDGSGPALYASGKFTSAGGVSVNNIAKWNGSTWSPLGSGAGGFYSTVYALAVFDDGGGPALYAGGDFGGPGRAGPNRVAKWDGSTWSPLGTGTDYQVYALTVFDDGNGSALYAGGLFTIAGGVRANNIAKWNGSTWSPLGSGFDRDPLPISATFALTVFDDGGGTALYAGGNFTEAGGVSASYIAKWNGSTWSPLGAGAGGLVHALSIFDDGSGPALYAGGNFAGTDALIASHIARWDGSTWSALGAGVVFGVSDLIVYDDGGGPALYAGGDFPGGEYATRGVLKGNGSSWSPLGQNMDRLVWVLAVFDDGGGPALYAGGGFRRAGEVIANNIAKWNGSAWSALGGGLTGFDPDVFALAVFDDGGGPALYAGGRFTIAGGVSASRIAKWNGSTWSSLGTGMNAWVQALTVFDDGSGPALYAGGFFRNAGGVSANKVAKWNGSTWSPLGTGLTGESPDIRAMTVFDDGSGPALYAGGWFTTAGWESANNIAKWNGSTWSPLGAGMNSWVHALTVFDDGDGPALYAGGQFTAAGGVSASYIARWNGSTWSPLGTGVDGWVSALTVFDDGRGPALYAGGGFTTAGGEASVGVAKWHRAVAACPTR